MANRLDPSPRTPRFFTVAEAAALLKVSEVTIYRGITAGEFPAVKIRGRYVIPARAIDEMEASALAAPQRTLEGTWADAERRLAAGDHGFSTPGALLAFAGFLLSAGLLLRVPGVGVFLVAALGALFVLGVVAVTSRHDNRCNAQLEPMVRENDDVEPPSNVDWQAWS